MAEPHVITALVKRRAELAGDIETTQAKLKQKILDLDHLDRTLLMFDPDYRIESIKAKAFRPPEDWSKRGQMTRIILGILRQAAEPLCSRDIAVQLVAPGVYVAMHGRLLQFPGVVKDRERGTFVKVR